MAARRLASYRRIGMVIKKTVVEGHPVVKVKCHGMKLNPHFLMYLPSNKEKIAVYPNVDVKEGDIVVIKNLEYKLTHHIRCEVERHFYKMGETYCPVTKMRCRGTEYIDSDYLSSVAGTPLDFTEKAKPKEETQESDSVL